MQTVMYSTRGNSDDYMYGDTTKPITFAMTPEVGPTSFWPPKAQIIPLAEENLLANKLLGHYAGSYPVLRSYSVKDSNGKYYVNLKIFNKGISAAKNYTLAVSSSSIVVPAVTTINEIQPYSLTEIPIAVTIPQSEQIVKLYVSFSNETESGFFIKDSIIFFAGNPAVVFSDNAANGTVQWTTGISWGTTSDAYSPLFAFTDSPNGNYTANTNNSLLMKNTADLSGFSFAELRFYTKWAVEPTWDFATVEISTNGGVAWTNLRSTIMQKASARSGSQQPTGTYGYDGFTPSNDWIEQKIDISSYVGKQIKIRFRLASDGSEERDGFYVDDIAIVGYTNKSLDVEQNTLPLRWNLAQNYPNPFNPETKISYQILKKSFVSLRVYDMLGREVITLVNSVQDPGLHTINFSAHSLSSGMYIYQLRAENFLSTKTMMVIK